MSLDKSDIVGLPTTTTDEQGNNYFSDVYSPGETKEQLIIGGEVAKPKTVSGTIDTSDSSITKVDNVYTLAVANPDGKIFSITIDGMSKVFKIGFFGNTALAYSTLETELQSWLGSDYTVTYVSGTDYTITRYDGVAISKSSPNLVRTITLTGFNSISKIDITIDATTVALDGATHGGSANTALTYLVTQLPTSTYYTDVSSNVLTIARIDGAIPTFNKTQYNRYEYGINYTYSDTPSSGQNWIDTTTTVDGVDFYTYGTQGRPFRGDWIVRNLGGYTENIDIGTQDSTSSVTTAGGTFITPNNQEILLTTVEKHSASTATRCLLRQGSGVGTILATTTFSGNVATFNYQLDIGVDYYIMADNNGAVYTQTFKNNPTRGGELTESNTSDVRNIQKVNTEVLNTPTGYTTSTTFRKSSGGSDSVWTSGNTALYFNQSHTLNINKSDYTAMTFASVTQYAGGFPNNEGQGYSITTINHLADITTATATEITITLTLTTNSYLIPCAMNIKKIIMSAISSGGTSEGTYELRTQSCTAKYSTTTTFVTNKIFKTDASNYGNIAEINRRGGFIMQWTTNTSNKLTYTCL